MYIMTRGGPDDATKVLTLTVYDTGFNFFRMGSASAMSVVMFGIVLLFTLLQLRLLRTDAERAA
jgi:multiple sugar transport system permease protein